MKKQALTELKSLEETVLQERVKKAKAEIADLIMDKNMNKLKDLKQISRKKKEVATIFTILRQKQLLAELGGQNK